MRLRLDDRWFASESEFLGCYLEALGGLPPCFRGHVSVATGLANPDDGFQIAWRHGEGGIDPDGAVADWLDCLGRHPAMSQSRTGAAISDEARFPELDGLVAPVSIAGPFHSHVRAEVRALLNVSEAIAMPDPSQCPPSHMPPLLARRVLEELRLKPRRARDFRIETNGQPAAPGPLICGLASMETRLDDVAAALDIIDSADCFAPSPANDRSRSIASELVRLHLAQKLCPSFDDMARIVASPGLHKLVAAEIAAGNRHFADPVRRALVVIGKTRDGGENHMRRLAGALLPRDHSISTDWAYYWEDAACLAQVFRAETETGRAIDTSQLEAVAETLIDSGRWNLVRDTLADLVLKLDRSSDGIPPEHDRLADKLRFVGSLGRALERASRRPAGGGIHRVREARPA